MGELFDRFDVEPIKGRDITIGEHFPEVFISESDEIFCYPGVCLRDNKHYHRELFMHPYYMMGKHSTDKEVAKEILGFYRITNGCMILDDYIDDGVRNNRLYKKIKCGIRFPCPDNYYAVFVDRIEDENLTRAIFGLTHEEITSLLDAYAITMGTHSDYGVYPRLTKSPRNTNFCDTTDIWIPKGFPYIAFNDSNYDFSHVSLWGFYRHIQLLTGYNINSLMSRYLLKAGANETTLQRIFGIDIGYGYSTKVTARIVNED